MRVLRFTPPEKEPTPGRGRDHPPRWLVTRVVNGDGEFDPENRQVKSGPFLGDAATAVKL